MKQGVALVVTSVLLLGAANSVLAETVFERIKRTGVLAAGTRGSSIPFSFFTEKHEWVGFDVDLLEAIRARLEQKLGRRIKLEKKEVDPSNRIQLVANRTLDIACASATNTRRRDRDESVDFSITYFFTGSQLLVKKASGITTLAAVAGKRVGTAARTTNERALRAAQPKAEILTFQDHGPGFLALEQGRIVAYAADGILLAGLVAKAKNPGDYEVVGDFFSREPYACAFPENESKWRDFVNHTFMELIDNGKFFELYDKWFGPRGVLPHPMSDQVRNYIIMQSVPE